MTRRQFGWDYPPGVTGNEPEINPMDIKKTLEHLRNYRTFRVDGCPESVLGDIVGELERRRFQVAVQDDALFVCSRAESAVAFERSLRLFLDGYEGALNVALSERTLP